MKHAHTEATLVGYAAGNTIAGRYELVSELGSGSMGVVWLVKDRELDNEPVCLKFLHPGIAATAESVKAMKAEARKLFRLTHPNICRLRDFARDESRPGCVFLIMEYIEGQSLRHILSSTPSGVEPLRVLRWAEQIARAVDLAHEQNILHRDIKPSNILIDLARDRAVLCDFGIARTAGPDATIGGVGPTSGTPIYMSPEQFDGLDSPRNDIYSLAATLYECLAGEPPFVGEGEALQRKVRSHAPQPVPGLSESLNRALIRGLSKHKEHRPASAAELVAEMKAGLNPFAPEADVASPAPDPIASSPAPAGPLKRPDPMANKPDSRPDHRGPNAAWWGLAAVLLLAAIIIAVPAWREAGVRLVGTWFAPGVASSAPAEQGAPPPAPKPSPETVEQAVADAGLEQVQLIARDDGSVAARGAVFSEAERNALRGRLRDRGVRDDLDEVVVDEGAVASQIRSALRPLVGDQARVIPSDSADGRRTIKIQAPPNAVTDDQIRAVASRFVYDPTIILVQRLGRQP